MGNEAPNIKLKEIRRLIIGELNKAMKTSIASAAT